MSGTVSHCPTRVSRSSRGRVRVAGVSLTAQGATGTSPTRGRWSRPAAASAVAPVACAPSGHSHHTGPPVTAEGRLMVISAPPATAPPIAVLAAHRVTAANPAPHGWTSYTVQAAATRSWASPRRFRTTVAPLAARNEHPRRATASWPGRTLSVPARASAAQGRRGATARGSRTVHVVRSGDTLIGIAARYRVTLDHRCSRRTGSRPARSSTPASSSLVRRPRRHGDAQPAAAKAATAYRVRSGDTLAAIAARHRTARSPPSPGQRHQQPRADPPRPAARRPGPHRAQAAPTAVPDTFNGVKYPRAVAEAAARNRAALARRRCRAAARPRR